MSQNDCSDRQVLSPDLDDSSVVKEKEKKKDSNLYQMVSEQNLKMATHFYCLSVGYYDANV